MSGLANDIRGILADLTGRPELRSIPLDTPLFGEPVALDSLTGTLLLREIRARYGVDVADEDINLDALATLGTLVAFVEARVTEAAPTTEATQVTPAAGPGAASGR